MEENNKKKDGAYASLKGFHRAVPVILFAVAIFTAVCFFTQNTGAVGRAISDFLLGCFSIGGYFIPAFLALHACFYPSDLQKKRILISRIIFSAVMVVTVSVLTHAIANWGEELLFSASDLYAEGKERIGGGFVGGSVAFAIVHLVDYVGLVILTLTVFALYIVYFLAGEKNALRSALANLLYKTVSFFARIEAKLKGKKTDKKEKRAKREEEEKRNKEAKRGEALMAKEEKLFEDEFFAVDNGFKELKIEKIGIAEHRRDEDIEKNPTLQEKVHLRSEVSEDSYAEPRRDETYESFTETPPTEQKGYTPHSDRRNFNTDYGISDNGDIVFDDAQPKEQTRSYPSYDASDRADAVFTKDFDPYSLKENERLANKPSSRVGEREGVTEIRRPETAKRTVSEAEIEAARRRSIFDARKEEVIKAARAAEANAQTNSQSYSAPTETPTERVYSAPVETPTDRVYSAPVETSTERVYSAPVETSTERVYSAPVETSTERVYSAPVETSTEFKSFTTPEPTSYAAAESEEDTLRITRSVMTDDTPAYDENDEEDDTLCVITEDSDTSYEEDDEDEDGAVFNFEDSDEEDESDAEEPAEIPPEKQNPDVISFRGMFNCLAEEDAKSSAAESPYSEARPYEEKAYGSETVATEEEAEEQNPYAAPPAYDTFEEDDEDEEEKEPESEDDVPFDDYIPVRSPVVIEEKKPEPKKPEAQKPDYSSFKFPPIDLLAKGTDTEDPSIEAEIQENGEKLIDALAQFNVRASVRSVDRGPRITRYEIVPARGVRVNSVISLFDDIALNLAAEGIRMEAPIPGKSAIGVEIPNKHPTTVMLRDLLETEEFKSESSKTFSCVGKDVTGNPVFGDMSKMPHILVAGATGMGKSVCINSILISILYKARPDEVKFIMIDPKTVEFTMYNGIPHLLVPVVTDVKQAAGALMWAIDEMNRRYELMAKLEVRKLDSYNDIVRENPELGEPLPKIIIVIDELNDLMQQVRKPVEGLITNITQKARAAGIHMIIGTQRPSVDVITGVIKANVPSRISCKVTSFNDSKTILDQAGAEKLLDKGDMLYAPVGKPKPVRVQGAFVSDGEVEKIMKFLKSNVKGAVYDEQAMEDMTRAAQKCSKGKDSSIDDDFDTDSEAEGGTGALSDKQFLEAADLAIRQKKISTSLIQRKIGVGYSKAAKFIDTMEDLGLVSEPNGQKPREVLLTREEWREMLSRRSLDD